jgi:hypothetical protein
VGLIPPVFSFSFSVPFLDAESFWMRFLKYLLLSGLTTTPFASAAPVSIFFNQVSTVYSEPVPIRLFEDDLRGGSFPESGHHAVTFNKAELGMGFGPVELANFIREDYAFDFNDETFALIYSDKNKLRIPDGTQFNVYLKAQHIKAQGWRLGYVHDMASRGKLRMSLNYLRAEDLLYGSLSGHVTVQNNDINGGSLSVLYYYHEDYILRRRIQNPASGEGYSVDLDADISLTDNLSLQLKFHDILGEIYWKDAPYSDLRIASTSTYYDEEGYARRSPMMTGVESYRNFKQPLPLHFELLLSQHLMKGLSLAYGREQYDKVVFNRLFFTYEPFGQASIVAGYDFTSRATWVGLTAAGFSLQVATDDYRLVESRTLVLRAGGHWRF